MDGGVENSIETRTDGPQAIELEAQLSAALNEIEQLRKSRDTLKAAYDRLLEELMLLKRRMFVAKAERVDSAGLQLEFKELLAQLDVLANTLGLDEPKLTTGESGAGEQPDGGAGDDGTDGDGKTPPSKRKGRRNLADLPLEEVRLELADDFMEELVAKGQAERIDVEESSKLAWQRGGMRRLIVARVKYRTLERAGESEIVTTPLPAELLSRCIGAPSMLAHVLTAKYCDGLPFARLEDILTRDGVSLDRTTMCRWAEELGGTFGATIVDAMRKDALANAFCIATDATGIAIQPEREKGRPRRPCDHGHYFVLIADRDHIWFEFTRKETSAAVQAMFGAYSGYVQVDAKSVYDVLFRDVDEVADDGEAPRGKRLEVGCWSHMRRKFWEAAFAKSPVAREALARIARIFELDATWQKKPPAEIKRLRGAHLRTHVVSLLDWIAVEYDKVRDQRSSLRSALGYAVRQRDALCRFLDDGRLRKDNNPSELQLRGRVAVGRKAWLFVGSDGHAQSAAGTMSLIASARLHKIDPESYLREIIRVLPHWPRDRYLELAPKSWVATRARLNPLQLAAEFGPLDIPDPPAPDTPDQQPPTN